MHINNHITPSPFGHGSRPDHAANGPGQAPQFQLATADTEPATTTDTTTAVAPAEETEGPHIPGNSVAHRAHAHLAQFAELGGNNFGWLVSQIARELFDLSAYAPDGEGTNGESTDVVIDGIDGTDGGETVVASDETAEAGTTTAPSVTDPVAGLLDTLTQDGEAGLTPPTGESNDPVADLIDALLEDGEDDPEVT